MNASQSLPQRVANSSCRRRSLKRVWNSSRLALPNCIRLSTAGLLLSGVVAALQPLAANAQTRKGQDSVTNAVPTLNEERIVQDAFTKTHDGWSVDEVLLRDDLRKEFVSKCQQLAGPQLNTTGDRFCTALLHLRKRGKQLPRASRRANSQRSESTDALAEIAARRVHDEFLEHTDALLVNSQIRKYFDGLIRELAPDADLYLYRKAAIKLRKTRRLDPELLARVTDWKKKILDFQLSDLSPKLAEIPKRPGIYIFRDDTGYLYIGQASDLRERLHSHLNDSDRKALAEYLTQASKARLNSLAQGGEQSAESTISTGTTNESGLPASTRLEVHVFKPGSPAENLGIRRAYESEMIRTRKPRFNVAP
ncbi:MAG: GIY-YIG nuclease family protein [Pirellulaceae bacterium]